MEDSKILDIIWNQKKVTNEELSELIWELCASAHPSRVTLSKYSHLSSGHYEDKIYKILAFVADEYIENFKIFETKSITKADIMNQFGVLPNYVLAQFLYLTESLTQYIIIDYEAPDHVEGFDDLLSVYETSAFEEIKNLNNEDIKKVIEFINSLDIFDIEIFKMYEANIIEEIKNDKNIKRGISYIYTIEEDDINNKRIFPTKPVGEFSVMIEYLSDGVDPDDDDYTGFFSKHDYNGNYIRDAMKDIEQTIVLEKKIQRKYGDKIKTVFLDFNKGCQYGCAIHIWIK